MTQAMASEVGKWWETGVIYQIYPLTFADGNGDGNGDLQGIIQRLDYLNSGVLDCPSSLGIDAIWLSPINDSPMFDNGYDVSNYYDICPIFGTLEDFKILLAECHQRQIRVILDLVVNHTSDRHEWFEESRASKDNPKSDWYHWQDANPDGSVPNNWLSYFGGTAWTYCAEREQYYYHAFNQNQPDLNWNNLEVRQAVYGIIRFWLDLGVDGFRLDASSVYSKDKYYRYNPVKFGTTDKNSYNNQDHLYDKNLPENHHIIREIRKVVDGYEDRVLIGETFIDSPLYDSTIFYGVDHDELHLPFNFEFTFSPWYPGYLQREIEKKELITPANACPTYFLDNHDIPRHLSRWIECSLCTNPQAIAQAAATILLTVRGTPVLYYGQEIGMVDYLDIPPEKTRDLAIIQGEDGELPPARDGSRTPMQWDDSVNAGFSFGKEVEPYLPVNENYLEVNVAQELAAPDSILNFYIRLIKIRKQSEALLKGKWRTLINYPYEHLAYVRETEAEKVLVIINFAYEKPLTVDKYIEPEAWQILISNVRDSGKIIALPKTLEAFEITVLQRRRTDKQ